MVSPSKLCSVCFDILQAGLEVVEEALYKEFSHHKDFDGFKQAAESKCFICTKLWDSISDASIAGWSRDPSNWKPFGCQLERRPWAPEWYGAVYWHIRYLVFDMDLEHDPKYRVGVFCLTPCQDDTLLESYSRDFESSTSSEKALQWACDWRKACSESHEICSKLRSSAKFAPSRLIDIGTEGDSWKLCLYPQDIPDPPNYLTLSYRWAQNPSIVLLTTNVDEFRRGLPISRLPKTFQEAIILARRLSVRYLWIDSLCIIQDSPDDWAKESVLMHQVYANSYCTISASASEGPDGGLFRSRTAEEALSGYTIVNFSDGAPKKFDIWDQYYIERLTQGPLTKRGWVYQERILSPGVLHFTQTQLVWECAEMNKCEMFPRWAPRPTEAVYTPELKAIDAFFDSGHFRTPFAKEEDKIMSVDVYQQWIGLVKAYSQCEFTCPDDRLMAMSGIAEMFRRNSGDEYLAGLWKSRLVEGLNWVVVDPVARPQNPSRVPSWSWAAVDSAVKPQRTNLPRDEDLVKVLKAIVEVPHTSTRWRHIKGSIQLRGCVSKATILESSRRSGSENVVVKLVEISTRVFAYPDTLQTTFEVGKVLHFLPLRSTLRRQTDQQGTETEKYVGKALIIIEGLILETVSDAENTFRRLGQFVVDDLDFVSFFGLVTTAPKSSGVATMVSLEDARTSIITLV